MSGGLRRRSDGDSGPRVAASLGACRPAETGEEAGARAAEVGQQGLDLAPRGHAGPWQTGLWVQIEAKTGKQGHRGR